MTILITGSSGKTSSRLAPLLPASHPPLIASRTGKPSKGGHATVRFDWLDSSTYELPFEHEQVKESPITGVYLVAPPVMDPQKYMNDFITFAKGKGVKRFVLLSSESIGAGGPLMGEVHQFLIDNVEEWCVLRPSWFMENFSEAQHLLTIKNEGKIYSATSTGKVPFVSTSDIAAVGARALSDEQSHNTDHIILGPELLTYDDAAKIFTDNLARKIEHVNLSAEDRAKKLMEGGLDEEYAQLLAALDVAIANGATNHMNDVVERVMGRPPKRLKAFVRENVRVWARV
ncbi:MAG: hypothetical protein MMC23_001923 [Stictis urceolatum]|nr:hypothetical protein [Stictis urceolata]